MPPEQENPFAAPIPTPAKPKLVVPGWLVLILAIVSTLMPLAAIGSVDAIAAAAVYGLPALIAVLIFAPTNVRAGRDRRTTIAAVLVACGTVIASVLLLLPNIS